jgi:addiction module HigA family antidote
MAYERGEIQRRPTHPGYVVRLELEELGMSVTEAAERLNVARPTLSQLVNERKRISAEMALKLGRFFGNGTELWLNMQTRYDRWEVEHDGRALRAAERIEPVHTYA